MNRIIRNISLFTVFTTSTATFATQIMTTDNGAAIGDNQHSYTAGANGSVLLQDVHLIQKLQRFARERIPERVVHPRGTGAHGQFVATRNLTALTKAAPFNKKGKITPVFVRFSSVIHGQGSPETLRDPRGFATKFYTDAGNWDLVGNNLPVFFIRDAIKFPDMVHSLKPSPVSNVQDPNRFFDFFSHEPGATHMLTWLYSDYGTPASYRKMDGWGVHAYKLVNAEGKVTYVKFHWKSRQGIDNHTAEEAKNMQSTDFNHMTNDLYKAIGQGDYPQWDLYIKVLQPSQLNDFAYNPLDATKMWLDIEEQKVGTMTLNKVPGNFFQETEQSAFAPANIIPGIEPSEDRLLQGRVFAYSDTQMHRLGVNHQSLPINAPREQAVNHHQDGLMNMGKSTSDINYQPSQQLNWQEDTDQRYSQSNITGYTQQKAIKKQDNFSQAGILYASFTQQEREHLIANLAGDLGKVNNQKIKHTLLAYFYKANKEYGTAVTKAVNGDLESVKSIAKQVK